jgi:hypothetical protein
MKCRSNLSHHLTDADDDDAFGGDDGLGILDDRDDLLGSPMPGGDDDESGTSESEDDGKYYVHFHSLHLRVAEPTHHDSVLLVLSIM